MKPDVPTTAFTLADGSEATERALVRLINQLEERGEINESRQWEMIRRILLRLEALEAGTK